MCAILLKILQIGADGFRSLVRQTTQVHSLQWEYENMGVVATLRLSEVLGESSLTFKVEGIKIKYSYFDSCLLWTHLMN